MYSATAKHVPASAGELFAAAKHIPASVGEQFAAANRVAKMQENILQLQNTFLQV